MDNEFNQNNNWTPPDGFHREDPGKPYRKEKKGLRAWGVILIAIASLLVGALIMAALSPMIFNKSGLFGDRLNINTPAPAVTATTPESTPAPSEVPQLGSTSAPAVDPANPVVDIAKYVTPSVVGVSNKVTTQSKKGPCEIEQASGSGFIISSDGLILTNYHVIEGSNAVTVILSGGKEVNAVIKGSDPLNDIAVLKIEEQNLTPVKFGDSSKLQVGEMAVAIGNPLGEELAGTVTQGVISALERKIDLGGKVLSLIQTDAAINPGNSGGPLLNAKGEVIAINTAKPGFAGYDENGQPITSEGIGFSIPINTVLPIVQEILQHGNIARPGLGIYGAEVTDQMAQQSNIPKGIYIEKLIPGMPSQNSGLQPDDIVIEVNGQKVQTMQDLATAITGKKVGEDVQVKVWRNGTETTVTVKLGDLNTIQTQTQS
jgi:serine protease Do